MLLPMLRRISGYSSTSTADLPSLAATRPGTIAVHVLHRRSDERKQHRAGERHPLFQRRLHGPSAGL